MKKYERRKASKRKDGVDFISKMPDSILILILSRLSSTEEGIRSSILSRRWRYLWTAVPSIDIREGGKLTPSEFKEYAYWVIANKSVDLDKFRLSFSTYYNVPTVWRWIHIAVTKNVKQLELRFCRKYVAITKNGKQLKDVTEDVEMPHCLVTCGFLEVLRLNFSSHGLRLPNFKVFPALRVLELTCVDLLKDDDLVNNFLESCPLLEDLTLWDCLTRKLNLLSISCLNLKKLTIFNVGEDEGMCGGIRVSCPKLVHLDLGGHIAYNFSIECQDSLKKAEIDPKLEGNSNTKSVLFPGISHVEYLLIELNFFYQCIKAACDPDIPNLKTLVLTTTIDAFNFDEFINVLKYYPKLKSLELFIKEEFYSREEWELNEGDAMRILTDDLKRIEFFGFNGEKPKVVSDWNDITWLEMRYSWV